MSAELQICGRCSVIPHALKRVMPGWKFTEMPTRSECRWQKNTFDDRFSQRWECSKGNKVGCSCRYLACQPVFQLVSPPKHAGCNPIFIHLRTIILKCCNDLGGQAFERIKFDCSLFVPSRFAFLLNCKNPSYEGDLQICRLLLMASAKIDCATPSGATALHYAAFGGSYSVPCRKA